MTRPSNIDTPDIGDRMREIAAERIAVIAGCACAADGNGNVNHRDGCPLYPGLPPATPPAPNGLFDRWTEEARQRHDEIVRREPDINHKSECRPGPGGCADDCVYADHRDAASPKPLGWADVGFFAILADHRRAIADLIASSASVPQRRAGRTKLVYDKAKRTIVAVAVADHIDDAMPRRQGR